MQVNVSYKRNVQFEATARGHSILSDQSLEDGGEDTGMTPPEWFLASLGSCIGFYAVKYLQTRGLDATGLNIEVSAQKIKEGSPRLDNLQIDVQVPIALEARHHAGLQRAVESCLIHNTLIHPPKMTTTIADGTV